MTNKKASSASRQIGEPNASETVGPIVSDAAKTADAASRRNFIKGGGIMLAGGAIAGSQVSIARGANAFGSDTIKIGLVGCGGRGTGAAIQALNTSGGDVKLVAMAD